MTLFEAADTENDFGGVQTGEVAGGFEAESDVGTGDDDCLAGEGLGGVGKGDEFLGVDEAGEGAAGWHGCGGVGGWKLGL